MGAYDCDCINNLEYDRRERKQKEQSRSTAGQLNDGARSTAQSTDLIDRQAAIDAVDAIGHIATMPDGDKCIRRSAVKYTLSMLPPAQPEPQWIQVERELPEDYVDVLVWFEYFRYGDYNCLYQTHGIGTYVANYNLWTVNHETGWKDLRVIAWMPLPEPYQSEVERRIE